DVSAHDVAIGAMGAQPAHAGVATAAAAISPKIRAVRQHGAPAAVGGCGVRFVRNVDGIVAHEWIEIAEAAGGEGFAVEVAETIADDGALRDGDDFLAAAMIFVEVIA